MKRTPLKPGLKGLRRTDMPPRMVELKRTALKRSPVELGLRKPGRPRVTAEERRARALVKARSGGLCEARGDAPATEWHHRKNRSQGGEWSAQNGLHVCSGCHAWITEHPSSARAKGWSVRSYSDPSNVELIYRAALVRFTEDGGLDVLAEQWCGGPVD